MEEIPVMILSSPKLMLKTEREKLLLAIHHKKQHKRR